MQQNDVETIRARDLAAALRGRQGTFLATRPGENLVVVCEEGHSIKSLRAVGSSYPSIPLGLSSSLSDEWEIVKISDSTQVFSEQRAQAQRSGS